MRYGLQGLRGKERLMNADGLAPWRSRIRAASESVVADRCLNVLNSTRATIGQNKVPAQLPANQSSPCNNSAGRPMSLQQPTARHLCELWVPPTRSISIVAGSSPPDRSPLPLRFCSSSLPSKEGPVVVTLLSKVPNDIPDSGF